MPNILYMTINFIYLTALSIWIGGAFSIGAITAPALFNGMNSRTESGEILGNILNKFNKVVLICIAVIFTASLIKIMIWENFNPWTGLKYIFFFIMSCLALYSIFDITPKMAKLKIHIKSFDNGDISDKDRLEFKRLHKRSTSILLSNILLGLFVLFLS